MSQLTLAAAPDTTESQHSAHTPATSAGGLRPRVCVLGEDLSDPPDEGIKKFIHSVAAALRPMCDLSLVATEAASSADDSVFARSGRTFLSPSLRRAVQRARPEVLLYVARSSTTWMSFLRTRLLKSFYPKARVVLVGLQARRLTRLQQAFLPLVQPDLVCVQSRRSLAYLRALGCRAELLPSGVDLSVFSPVPPARRLELRRENSLDPTAPVALHVGHLKASRGVRALGDLASRGVCQVVLVTSTSTAADAGLAEELKRSGVRVITHYVPRIETLYQLADCYVFPVESTDDCIEVPLSILEALACGLPVVTTRFGGVPDAFGAASAAITLVDSASDLVRETVRVCRLVRSTGSGVASLTERSDAAAARNVAQRFGWEAVASRLLEQALPTQSPYPQLRPHTPVQGERAC